MRISTPSLAAVCVAVVAVTMPAARLLARDRTPGFDEHVLELPGMPAAVVPADVDADGVLDLAVLVAYTAWGETATTAEMHFDDIEGLVEVMNVVSALVDHRELRVYRGTGDPSRYEPRPATLDLDSSIHVLQAGAADWPLLALTDEGVSSVRLLVSEEGSRLTLEPLIESESLFSGKGEFFAEFPLLARLDGDDLPELILPVAEGWSIYGGTPSGFTRQASRLQVVDTEKVGEEDKDQGDQGEAKEGRTVQVGAKASSRDKPRPRPPAQLTAADLNGDGLVDLFRLDSKRPVAYLQSEALSFSTAVEIAVPLVAEEEVFFVGSLDQLGAKVVSQRQIELPEDAGVKMEIDDAKRPDFEYSVYPLDERLKVPAEPLSRFVAEGYTFAGSDDPSDDVDMRLPGGFKDLDGDGRQDLVAITLEFAALPMLLRALVTRRIALTMDLRPWCQRDDGSFHLVTGLDLEGRFKLDMRNVQVKHLSQFAGDFNGDGRADFVQLGRGRRVTIHHGGAHCRYPTTPSVSLRLAKEPKHLGLVRILDLDGDDRSDLYVVHPLKPTRSGESTPTRVDLYLSSQTDPS